jgi:hypothetical protein
MGGACSTYGRRNVYGFSVVKPEGLRPFGRPRLRCEDNFKMDLQEMGWGYMDWTDVVTGWKSSRQRIYGEESLQHKFVSLIHVRLKSGRAF